MKLLILPILLLLLTACSDPKAESASVNEPLSSPTPTITQSRKNIAVLGTTEAVFEKVYGPNSGTQNPGRFKDGYITTLQLDDKIWHVALHFAQTDTPKRTQKEALALAQPFLPNDSVQIGEWQEDPATYIVHYESKKLVSAFSQERRGALWWEGVKPGTILIIMNHEKGDKDAVVSVDIEPGDPEYIGSRRNSELDQLP